MSPEVAAPLCSKGSAQRCRDPTAPTHREVRGALGPDTVCGDEGSREVQGGLDSMGVV